MTHAQKNTLTVLGLRGYTCAVVRRENHGVIKVIVNRRLSRGMLELHIAADGIYKRNDPSVRFTDLRKGRQWQTLK